VLPLQLDPGYATAVRHLPVHPTLARPRFCQKIYFMVHHYRDFSLG